MFETILCEVTEYDASVLEPLIGLAVEISREESANARNTGGL
jgi:hypothetical protein